MPPAFYLTTSSSFTPSPPKNTLKRSVRWLKSARRVLKPGGTLWVTGTHHISFSIGFALQSLDYRIINSVVWEKPDPPPNALHTAFTQVKATENNPRPS